MKRLVFLASLLVSVVLMNFSESQAATVRVADVGVYNLIQDMRTTVRDINKEMTNFIPVTIGNAVRAPQLDKNYIGYSGWTSKIYREGTTDQKAWIDFYVNEQGYVSRLNIALLHVEDLNAEDGQSFGGLLSATLMSLEQFTEIKTKWYNVCKKMEKIKC